MAEQQQNGVGKPPEIPEGTEYLFVTFNPRTAEYAIVFSTITGALALHSMASTSLEKMKRDAICPDAAPAVQPASSLLSHDVLRNLGRQRS